MALQDPRQKRVGPFSVDDGSAELMPRAPAAKPFFQLDRSLPGAPARGSAMAKADAYGLQHPSNFMGVPLAGAGAPALQPGQAAPDVNPLPSATRFGVAVRDADKGLQNAVTSSANRALRVGATLGNALTRPLRSASGWGVDALRAAAGDAPREGAGQPFAPMVAPQLAMPNKPPVVNFVTGSQPAPAVPVRNPVAGAAVASDPRNYDPAADNISANNLAAAARLTNPATAAVTAPATPAATGGTDVVGADGKPRHLNYGSMVDGVPTFSDGTGGPNGSAGSIPNTMTPDAMARLAKAPSIGRADVGALGHALASDALGGTATQEQMIGQRMAQLSPAGSRPSAEMFAASDRNAIALRDPRSAAGIAAHNLDMEAQYARTPRARRIAEQGIAQLTRDAGQSGLLAQQQHGQEASDYTQGQNQLANTELQGKNTLANTALEQRTQLLKPRAGQQVTLADGTLGVQDTTTGLVTPSKLADGTTAKAQVTRDDTATKRTQALIDQLNKGVQEQMKSFLPSKDAPEPTPQMISQWRGQQALAMNLPIVSNQKTGERMVNVNGQWMPL